MQSQIVILNKYGSNGAFLAMLRDWFMERSTMYLCTNHNIRECAYKLCKFYSSLQTELVIEVFKRYF